MTQFTECILNTGYRGKLVKDFIIKLIKYYSRILVKSDPGSIIAEINPSRFTKSEEKNILCGPNFVG